VENAQVIRALGPVVELNCLVRHNGHDAYEEYAKILQPELEVEIRHRDAIVGVQGLERKGDVGGIEEDEAQDVEEPDEKHVEQCKVVQLHHHGRGLHPQVSAECHDAHRVILGAVTIVCHVIVGTACLVRPCKDNQRVVERAHHPDHECLPVESLVLGTMAIQNRVLQGSVHGHILIQDECDDREKQDGVVAGDT